jgi:hypothetical protein
MKETFSRAGASTEIRSYPGCAKVVASPAKLAPPTNRNRITSCGVALPHIAPSVDSQIHQADTNGSKTKQP